MAEHDGFGVAWDALQDAYPDVAFLYYDREELDERRVDGDGVSVPLTDEEWPSVKNDLIHTVYNVVSRTDVLWDIAARSLGDSDNEEV